MYIYHIKYTHAYIYIIYALLVDSLVDINEQKIDMIPTNNALFGADMKLALDIMRSEYFTLESYQYAGDGMMLTDWIVLALSPIGKTMIIILIVNKQCKHIILDSYFFLLKIIIY